MTLLLLAAIGCASDNLIVPDDAFYGDDEVEDAEGFDGATLRIDTPSSGSFVAIEDPAAFEATVLDADGNALEFDEIEWSTSLDNDWGLTGALVETDDLEIGEHDFTATAILPNGDRLQSTVGGVLVQSDYAGIYSGTMRVDLGTEDLSVACSGASTITVVPEGDVVEGIASCFLSFQGIDLDGDYVVSLENDDGALGGDISLDLFGFEIPLGFDGEIDREGTLTGGFEGDLFGYGEVIGQLDAVRLTRDTSPE